MPYLFCNDCGEEKTKGFSEAKMLDGESVEVVIGDLLIECICDLCNSQLNKGDRAFHCSFLPEGYEFNISWIDDFFERNRIVRESFK
jgi:hypothetical protein